MPRHQTGQLIVKSGRFYLRYYTADTDNGSKKVMRYLCDVDREPWHERKRGNLVVSDAAKRARDKFMLAVNSNCGVAATPAGNPTVGEFWEDTFRPSFVARELRLSTVQWYQKTWDMYVKAHLEKWRCASTGRRPRPVTCFCAGFAVNFVLACRHRR